METSGPPTGVRLRPPRRSYRHPSFRPRPAPARTCPGAGVVVVFRRACTVMSTAPQRHPVLCTTETTRSSTPEAMATAARNRSAAATPAGSMHRCTATSARPPTARTCTPLQVPTRVRDGRQDGSGASVTGETTASTAVAGVGCNRTTPGASATEQATARATVRHVVAAGAAEAGPSAGHRCTTVASCTRERHRDGSTWLKTPPLHRRARPTTATPRGPEERSRLPRAILPAGPSRYRF